MTLLTVQSLGVSFRSRNQHVRVLNGVGFSVGRAGIVGILEEGGSAKSLTTAAIMRRIKQPPGRIETGRILHCGQDVLLWPRPQHRALCAKRLPPVFPYALASLNPVHPVGCQIAEMFAIHGLADGAARATIRTGCRAACGSG